MKRPQPAKNPPSFVLRPVAPPDDGFLLRLYATTRASELSRSGWDAAQRDAFLHGQFQARRADYAVRYPGADHSVITINGADAGACLIRRTPTEIQLVNIELLPAHQGRGIGSTLLRRLLAEAKSARLPVRLSVRDDNHAATRLYRRLGFAITTRDAGYLRMEKKP